MLRQAPGHHSINNPVNYTTLTSVPIWTTLRSFSLVQALSCSTKFRCIPIPVRGKNTGNGDHQSHHLQTKTTTGLAGEGVEKGKRWRDTFNSTGMTFREAYYCPLPIHENPLNREHQTSDEIPSLSVKLRQLPRKMVVGKRGVIWPSGPMHFNSANIYMEAILHTTGLALLSIYGTIWSVPACLISWCSLLHLSNGHCMTATDAHH